MSALCMGLGTSPGLNGPSWLTPHSLVLAIVWLATTVPTIVMLSTGVRKTGKHETARTILHVVYVAALIWTLVSTGPSFKQLPALEPLLLRRWPVAGQWLPVLGIALVLALVAFRKEGTGIVLLTMIAATVWILVAWRQEIRLRPVLLGLAVAGLAVLGGLPFWKNRFAGKAVLVGLPALVPPMFLAGGILLQRTGLAASPLHAGQYGKALAGCLWGCLLFVPLGLFNAADGPSEGGLAWVNRWWMPATLPWFSGIAEETWYRLFLVSLAYWLLRPAFPGHPALAAGLAAFFSATTFGLGHGRTLNRFLTTGLLYGLPMAVLFVRRDWEHAVGAHYMINAIPWLMAFLES